MNKDLLKNIVEAAILAAGKPLSLNELRDLFKRNERPELAELRTAIETLQEDYQSRGIELVEVATGYRIQIGPSMIDWLTKLWEERPPRYSRALMETLALIAYRQPITRGDVEDIRGVAVSTNIIRTLLERGWIKEVGHREVPGKPALFGTTPLFLEYFGLRKLDDLPPLAEITDLDSFVPQLELAMSNEAGQGARLHVVVDGEHEEELVMGAVKIEPGETANDSDDVADEPTVEESTLEELTVDGSVDESTADEITVDESTVDEKADAISRN